MKNTNYLKLIFTVAVIFAITGFVRTDVSDSPKEPSSIEVVNGVEIILGEIPTNLEFSTIYLKVDKSISGLSSDGYTIINDFDSENKYEKIAAVLSNLGASIDSFYPQCLPWEIVDLGDANSPVQRLCCVPGGGGFVCWIETCVCGYCCGN